MSRNLARRKRSRFKTHYQREGGLMERTRLLQDSTTDRNASGMVLVAGDCSQDVLSQLRNDEIQKDELKIRADTHARQGRYGLPCAKCKAYYASDLPACPICKCTERVAAQGAEVKSAKPLKKASAGVLQRALRSFINHDSNPAPKQRRLA